MKTKIENPYLLVVNGYSLGAITILLDRLNSFIDVENGHSTEPHCDFFFNAGPNSFDEQLDVFRYNLEDGVIEIIEDLASFCGTGIEGFRSHTLLFETCIENDIGVKKREKKHLLDIIQADMRLKCEGLTLNQWNEALQYYINDVVLRKIKIFIPDYEFELNVIHEKDYERYVSNKEKYL